MTELRVWRACTAHRNRIARFRCGASIDTADIMISKLAYVPPLDGLANTCGCRPASQCPVRSVCLRRFLPLVLAGSAELSSSDLRKGAAFDNLKASWSKVRLARRTLASHPCAGRRLTWRWFRSRPSTSVALRPTSTASQRSQPPPPTHPTVCACSARTH